MARVTVEDCLVQIPDRFELVILAAHRARLIGSGSPSVLPRERDKDAVLVLREIAETTVSVEELREGVIESCRTSPLESSDALSSNRGPSRKLTHAEFEEDEWFTGGAGQSTFDLTSFGGNFDL